MSTWPGKFVIGLTGNIATGKSVVRKMLEHLGAYGIDADALGHRAIAQGAPGYLPVLDAFGRWILYPDGQIDRTKLARIVFGDPKALETLEAIVHPLVGEAVAVLARRSKQKVIVIEAIKLLESDLRGICDTLWVTYAPEDLQLARMIKKRKMSEETASQRISIQTSHEEKIEAANTIIRNDGSFEETWRQVSESWHKLFPASEPAPKRSESTALGEMVIQRARPRQASEIAELINRLSVGKRSVVREDVMAAFGEKAFLLVTIDDILVGLTGWQVENLVSRMDDVYLEPDLPFEQVMRLLTREIERSSRELQCEVSLVFLPPHLARKDSIWRSLGYQERAIASLGVRAWKEAAVESMPARGATMYFKQIRKDRVLRPF